MPENSEIITTGITVVNCENPIIENNTSIGNTYGIVVKNSPSAIISSNVTISIEALHLLESIDRELLQLRGHVTQDKLDEVIDNIKTMKSSIDTPSFKDKYTQAVSSISDHVTILSALSPLLIQLGILYL
jgi:parallel beta-helix repeat protein